MENVLNEFVDGLKKPFQTTEQQQSNQGNAVASYGLLLAIFALLRS